MRAVVLNAAGEPALTTLPEPGGPGEPLTVLACGLCGSDLEKMLPAFAGAVLGHEVVAQTGNGRRVVLVHHLPCGRCRRCRAGRESTCDAFREATIIPGGLGQRVRATGGWFELPDAVSDSIGTFAEPLACVLRGAERVPRGRVLVVGQGFIGRVFAAVLRRRGDDVFVFDSRPERSGRAPDGDVDGAVLCAPGGAEIAAGAVAPGGTVAVFASAGPLDLDTVYRRELQVVGSRSATPRHMREAVALLPQLDLPEPEVLPLSRFAEGLARYRSGAALKVVFRP